MKSIAACIVVLVPCLAAAQDAGSINKLISDALLPLPEPLRADATVVLDREPGKREVLRKGTNQVICRANPPGTPFFIVRCYHKDLDPLLTRIDELSASRTPEHQLHEAISAEIKSGKLKVSLGGTAYTLAGADRQGALPIMVVFMPGATSESTGLSSQPNSYRPWLMYEGTPMAHIMIPGK